MKDFMILLLIAYAMCTVNETGNCKSKGRYDVCCSKGYTCKFKGCIKESFLFRLRYSSPPSPISSPFEKIKETDWESFHNCVQKIKSKVIEPLMEYRKNGQTQLYIFTSLTLARRDPNVFKCFINSKAKDVNMLTSKMLKKIEWNSVLKCLLESKEESSQVKDLIYAIKKKKKSTTLTLANDLLDDGNEYTRKCIRYVQVQKNLKLNWTKLLKCLMNLASEVPDIIALIKEIKAKHWRRAIELIIDLFYKSNPIIKECIHSVTFNKRQEQMNKLSLEYYEKLLECAKNSPPLTVVGAKKFEAFTLAVKNQDVTQTGILYADLTDDGTAIVHKCIGYTDNQSEKTDDKEEIKEPESEQEVKEEEEKLKATGDELEVEEVDANQRETSSLVNDNYSIEWSSLLQCLMETDTISEEIAGLAKTSNKNKTEEELISKGYDIFKEGTKMIKKCFDGTTKVFPKLIDWQSLTKCFLKEIPSKINRIQDFFEAIKAEDYITSFTLGYTLAEDGNTILNKCLTPQENLLKMKIDWEILTKCLSVDPIDIEVKPLIESVHEKRFDEVKNIALELFANENKIFNKCWFNSKLEEGKIISFENIEWEKVIRCSFQYASNDSKEELILLIEAIEAKDFSKVTGIAMKLYQPSSNMYTQCLAPIIDKDW